MPMLGWLGRLPTGRAQGEWRQEQGICLSAQSPFAWMNSVPWCAAFRSGSHGMWSCLRLPDPAPVASWRRLSRTAECQSFRLRPMVPTRGPSAGRCRICQPSLRSCRAARQEHGWWAWIGATEDVQDDSWVGQPEGLFARDINRYFGVERRLPMLDERGVLLLW